ncbi:Anaerobic magnesium-protoporphyrin IX monomethyl ester cyclase [BD1-7 clade bacterium]|uniref:Anaerobic magnesium-protoporphyrin IX monomethyl ester cyclase n=1 Tax=BD1-7 clade bacterium TaxID=2029982 RepID=A0A5S9PEU8_9GAMM|nr:Anaerobic magnesium-protoporphyrin IX monomethyl ester cyclase [BD1-7 clade bacterium]
MHKILLAHAFFLNNDEKQIQEKFKPYPPLATLYAASQLRGYGNSVSLFDASLSSGMDEFRQTFNALSPDILVIYEDDFNFLTKMCLAHVRDATLEMIHITKKAHTIVIVHSSDASDQPDVYLENGADYVIAGEADETLAELVDALSEPQADALPDGVIYREKEQIIHCAKRSPQRNIDKLKPPAWDLVDFENYRQSWTSRHGYFSVNLVSTRGCPYRCNWCAKPIWGQQYATHSPNYVADQIAYLHQHAEPDHIWFADDIFGLKKLWVKQFAAAMDERKIKIPFTIQSRADLIDDDVASNLAIAGCEEVWMGMESGSQTILDRMDKDIQIADARMATAALRQNKIKVGFFIQLGYPGEDIPEIEQTRDLILDILPDSIGVSVSYPLPGTSFYDKVKRQMSEKTHWQESNDLDAVFNSTFRADFYRKIRHHLHTELKATHAQHENKVDNKIEWDTKWRQLMSSADNFRTEAETAIALIS